MDYNRKALPPCFIKSFQRCKVIYSDTKMSWIWKWCEGVFFAVVDALKQDHIHMYMYLNKSEILIKRYCNVTVVIIKDFESIT